MNVLRFASQTPPPGNASVRFPEIQQASGKFVLVSGPSGVGKGTILKELLADPEVQRRVGQVPSIKTRPPRPGEENDPNVEFHSVGSFEQLDREGKLFQRNEYGGHHYGLKVQHIVDRLRQGLTILFEMAVPEALKLKSEYPDKVTTVFIAPPAPERETLEKRLRKRGESSDVFIADRLRKGEAELAQKNNFDQVIVSENDKITDSVAALKRIILQSPLFRGLRRAA